MSENEEITTSGPMDDQPAAPVDKAAAAREARRRRILENSSKRLEKITGRNAEEFDKEKEREQIIYPDPDEEPILSEPSPLRPHAQNDMASLFGGGFGAAGGAGGQFPMMGDENMANLMQQLLGNMGANGGFSMGAAFGGGGSGGLGGQHPAQEPEVPDNWIVKLIRTRIPIMLVAAVVFVLFHTDHSGLLSGNVLLSLLLWETVELFLLKYFNKLNAKKSKITFVLSLFNVPPHLVDRCLTMLGMFHKIVQDFSVFMFIFVFLHYFWPSATTTASSTLLTDNDDEDDMGRN